MKAVCCTSLGPPSGLSIQELPTPSPASGEVLVRVHRGGFELSRRADDPGAVPGAPPAAVYARLRAFRNGRIRWPRGHAFQPGERVLRNVIWGPSPSWPLCRFTRCGTCPYGLDDDQAAAFPLVYQTSYFGLIYRGQLAPGETVLVHSAAGGVGLAAVQIARAYGAGKIIGTVGSDDKRAAVQAAGADLVLNYQTDNIVDAVKEATGGRGADVIYDPVGGDLSEQSTRCIAFEGRR